MNKRAKIYLAVLFILFPIILYYSFINLDIVTFSSEIVFFIVTLLVLMNLNTIYYKSKILTVIFLPALIPSIVMYEPFWVILMGFVGSMKLTELQKENFIWYKFLFNRIMIGFAAGAATFAFNTFYNGIYNFNILVSILIASFVYFLVNNVLLFIIVRLTEGKELSYFIFISEIIRNVFISFFLGMILYFKDSKVKFSIFL